MAKNSSIEWTHHTFNPWWGCVKVSEACRNCYAESWAKRVGSRVWGSGRERRFFGDRHWRQPLRWNREAEDARVRRRVFCASMADVFEGRSDLNRPRERLWDLIEETPWLDWLLLTKRPERVGEHAPWRKEWPRNVWLGTSVEDQFWAERRIPALLRYAAAVRFLSCEPLLGPLDLSGWLSPKGSGGTEGNRSHWMGGVDWVIAGGESGPRARPMNPEWARSLRDQCNAAEVPFHFKQWGHWAPGSPGSAGDGRELEVGENGLATTMVALGKKEAGRLLDGSTWDQFPRPQM